MHDCNPWVLPWIHVLMHTTYLGMCTVVVHAGGLYVERWSVVNEGFCVESSSCLAGWTKAENAWEMWDKLPTGESNLALWAAQTFCEVHGWQQLSFVSRHRVFCCIAIPICAQATREWKVVMRLPWLQLSDLGLVELTTLASLWYLPQEQMPTGSRCLGLRGHTAKAHSFCWWIQTPTGFSSFAIAVLS